MKKLKTLKLLYLMVITKFCAFESLRDIVLAVADDGWCHARGHMIG